MAPPDATAGHALRRRERVYNFERFSLALYGQTPVQKLTRLLLETQVA